MISLFLASCRGRLAAGLVLTMLAVLAAGPAAMAQTEIDITGGRIDPLPIAIAPFLAGGGAEEAAATISGVVTNDLGRSGYFAPIDPQTFIERIASFEQMPDFASWRQVKAKALVSGQAVIEGDKLRVEFRLWDVNTTQQLAAQQFTTSPKNARRIGHMIADIVYKAMTGIDGYFDTRIVFVAEQGPKDKRVKTLVIMDQDGFNIRPLSDGKDLVLTPRFSPSANEITYMSFGSGEPRVYLMNIDTRQREIVGEFPNMSFAPRFSPDGQRVIMSLQEGGNANIFELDLRSRSLRQLTNVAAINTAPSYSPDGSMIAFESDRGGTQQIYVMNADGSNQNRISFGQGRYSTPVWSPDGNYIAFTKQSGGKFAIGVMKPDGSGERILTEGFHNEGPTWAPNSRVLMFFRDTQGESGGPQLWSVDISGYNEQRVPIEGFGSDPAWSPKLN
ncbi:MAG: Tol-Pal system beta propeller repeat protein TolB [Aestuariivirga sp.]|uniref:Tol-Pal system beta propeller repeat protein TolB n=1 Tax=Aestuariivirga sp. TaxID=2650926 RepID=UPI0038D14967